MVSGWLVTLSLQEPDSGSGDGHSKRLSYLCLPKGRLPAVKNPPFTLCSAVRLPSSGALNHTLKAALSIQFSGKLRLGMRKCCFQALLVESPDVKPNPQIRKATLNLVKKKKNPRLSGIPQFIPMLSKI